MFTWVLHNDHTIISWYESSVWREIIVKNGCKALEKMKVDHVILKLAPKKTENVIDKFPSENTRNIYGRILLSKTRFVIYINSDDNKPS